MAIINCDMGESFGLYRIGDDEALMPLISRRQRRLRLPRLRLQPHARRPCGCAKKHGVKVGAHPSLPDLQGFGRREMKMPREELANCILYQVGALKGFLDAEGMPLNHIKPHGALYGMAARHGGCGARRRATPPTSSGVPLMGMAGTLHETSTRRAATASSPSTMPTSTIADDGSLIITREHEASRPGGSGGALACARSRRARPGRSAARTSRSAPTRSASIPTRPTPSTSRAAVREAVQPYLEAA